MTIHHQGNVKSEIKRSSSGLRVIKVTKRLLVKHEKYGTLFEYVTTYYNVKIVLNFVRA